MSHATKPLFRAAAVFAVGIAIGALAVSGNTSRIGVKEAEAAIPQRGDTVPCGHDSTSVWNGCDFFLSSSGIEQVSVTLRTRGGRTYTLRSRVPYTDAIFLTKDAAKRFLVAYYVHRQDENTDRLTALTAKINVAKTLEP